MNRVPNRFDIEIEGDLLIKVLKGNIIYTREKEAFDVHEDSYLVIEDKRVVAIYKVLPEIYKVSSDQVEIIDYSDAIIIPSLIDLHVHAPQFMQRGLGLNLQLIDWLNQYTFIFEQRFEDIDYAQKVYSQFAETLYENGTLRSVIYGTIHNKSNDVLIQELKNRGLSAYVGKVNMDQNAPEALLQTSDLSIKETREFILKHQEDAFVKPIITPRFAPSCSSKLLRALGNLSKEMKVPIQSHLSENLQEVEWVKQLFPNSENYTSVYKDHGLYSQEKTFMAHAIYLNDQEIQMVKNNHIILVHCPYSNLNLMSGIMPLTRYLDQGLQVGMGSDVGAGHIMGMNHTICSAIQCSKMLHIFNQTSRILSEAEAFYLTTKANGSFFGKVGSFEPDYLFDALVIKDSNPLLSDLTPLEQLQRFLYCGGSESIVMRYLEGKVI